MTDSGGCCAVPSGTCPVHVCMVDDDPGNRQLVTMVLTLAAISIKACPLGWPAHQCIRTTLPKVILLDVQMPDVDGIQLFNRLRSDSATRDIPIIFLTASPAKVYSQVPNYQEMGATLLPKPFVPEDLLGLVRTAIAM
jgi:CheY-like chemotaxis protein